MVSFAFVFGLKFSMWIISFISENFSNEVIINMNCFKSMVFFKGVCFLY